MSKLRNFTVFCILWENINPSKRIEDKLFFSSLYYGGLEDFCKNIQIIEILSLLFVKVHKIWYLIE